MPSHPFRPALAVLAALTLAIILTPARSDDSPNSNEQQIAELEKQLAALKQKLAELKNDGSLPPSWVSAFQWRCIGPAAMGGRITAISVCEDDPCIYWIATASGGLLKTTN